MATIREGGKEGRILPHMDKGRKNFQGILAKVGTRDALIS
jgi:hypothetical protein